MKYLSIAALVVFSLINGAAFAQDVFPKAQFPRDVRIDVARQKSTKFEGGDYDDRTEKLSFKVSLQNSSKNAFTGVQMEFYLLGQSVSDKKVFKLMQVYKETFTLDPLQPIEFDTPEVTTMWDDSGAVFGVRYKCWIVRFLAPDGTVMVEKSTSSFFTNTKKLPELKEGEFYTKTFEKTSEPRY